MGLEVGLLAGRGQDSLQTDIGLLAKSDLVVATAERWEWLSRKFAQRKQVLAVGLYVIDSVHLLGHPRFGARLEMLMSRINTIRETAGESPRVVAISCPMANAKDLCEVLQVKFSDCCFNFHPSTRASCPSIGPLQVSI